MQQVLPDYHRVTINRTERNAHIPFGKLARLEYVYSFLAFSASVTSKKEIKQHEKRTGYFNNKQQSDGGERIRYYRKRQKMTLRELGEKSGFENRGDVRIAQYENGSRVPRTGTLNRIAKALGIPPEELFCEDCRKCMFLKNYYRKKRKSHTTFDMGIEEDNSYREHKNPEDEGILYDNLD